MKVRKHLSNFHDLHNESTSLNEDLLTEETNNSRVLSFNNNKIFE